MAHFCYPHIQGNLPPPFIYPTRRQANGISLPLAFFKNPTKGLLSYICLQDRSMPPSQSVAKVGPKSSAPPRSLAVFYKPRISWENELLCFLPLFLHVKMFPVSTEFMPCKFYNFQRQSYVLKKIRMTGSNISSTTYLWGTLGKSFMCSVPQFPHL